MASQNEELEDRPPLTLDEVAQLPPVAPTEDAPPEVAQGLARRRLRVSGVPGGPAQLDADIRSRGEEDPVVEMVLPEQAQIGEPGRTGDLLSRSDYDLPAQSTTEPMRPAWAPQSAQPHQASQRTVQGRLRRLDGTSLEPHYGIYGPDDRAVYYPGSYPWHSVGRIFTWTNRTGGSGGWSWWGSGVLVGPRHVLTAGHVCPWGAASWAMKFVPGYWNGAPASGAGAESFVSDYRGWNTNNTVAAHDMAVLRLFEPVGSWLGWMGTKTYSSSWEDLPVWTLAGYPGAVAAGERPSYQTSIPVLDDDSDGSATEIEHHGDASGGVSGGPFFGWWDEKPYAIGAHSGGQATTGTPFGLGDEDNNVEAGGQAMVDLVLWAHQNWPA